MVLGTSRTVALVEILPAAAAVVVQMEDTVEEQLIDRRQKTSFVFSIYPHDDASTMIRHHISLWRFYDLRM